MGITRYILYDGIKSAIKSSRNASKVAKSAPQIDEEHMHKAMQDAAQKAAEKFHTSKSAVTVGDVHAVVKKVEETRSDVHLLGHDMIHHHDVLERHLTNHVAKLSERLDEHSQLLKQIIDIIKQSHGLG